MVKMNLKIASRVSPFTPSAPSAHPCPLTRNGINDQLGGRVFCRCHLPYTILYIVYQLKFCARLKVMNENHNDYCHRRRVAIVWRSAIVVVVVVVVRWWRTNVRRTEMQFNANMMRSKIHASLPKR